MDKRFPRRTGCFRQPSSRALTHSFERRPRDRLDQVEPLLDEIAALEIRLGKYYKTFFLDHAQEQFRFPPQFNGVIIRVILARLGLGTRPEPRELKALWQWVPEGCRLVPIVC
ncbi:hypothetical protein ACN4EG_18485 [Alkalinema pantanalense CENA528]|uniref:hypothetical protein n=1 Tax=Alkalinema pantanalense TaxID=1620705 RepID=UPI003D6EE567